MLTSSQALFHQFKSSISQQLQHGTVQIQNVEPVQAHVNYVIRLGSVYTRIKTPRYRDMISLLVETHGFKLKL